MSCLTNVGNRIVTDVTAALQNLDSKVDGLDSKMDAQSSFFEHCEVGN